MEALLSELQNIGRNEAVNLIVSALRPTSDLVPVNMRKQTGVRIQMHGPDEEELGHMFGWKTGVSMDQLAGKGTAFISIDGATPRPFRVYNVLPAQIEQAALSIAVTRPELDPASADAAGEPYATRAQRMHAAFTDLDTDDMAEDDAPAALAPAPSTGRRLTVVPTGADSWPDPFHTPDTPTSPAPALPAADWDDPRPQITHTRLIPAVSGMPGAPTPGWPLPEILRRALQAFTDADDDRMHSATLAETLNITPTEMAALLRALGIAPLENAFSRDGITRRGYARQDLITAAQRIHRREINIPDEVARWPAA